MSVYFRADESTGELVDVDLSDPAAVARLAREQEEAAAQPTRRQSRERAAAPVERKRPRGKMNLTPVWLILVAFVAFILGGAAGTGMAQDEIDDLKSEVHYYKTGELPYDNPVD